LHRESVRVLPGEQRANYVRAAGTRNFSQPDSASFWLVLQPPCLAAFVWLRCRYVSTSEAVIVVMQTVPQVFQVRLRKRHSLRPASTPGYAYSSDRCNTGTRYAKVATHLRAVVVACGVDELTSTPPFATVCRRCWACLCLCARPEAGIVGRTPACRVAGGFVASEGPVRFSIGGYWVQLLNQGRLTFRNNGNF